MATPSYAQGNTQAAAAAKAEAAKLAAFKKVAPAIQGPPIVKAPAIQGPPIVKSNMPAYAVSNEVAKANSLANVYNVKAADAKAKADAMATAFKNTITPQTDAIVRASNANTFETDEQKRARLLKDGSVATRARTMTPAQQKELWGTVVDTNGGQNVAPQLPSIPLPSTMPVQATGDMNKIQQYTTSNVAPMTDAEKQKAFIGAVNTRTDVLDSLGGSKVIPSSSTATQNQAIQDVMTSMGIAQGRTSVSPPAQQPAAAVLGENAKPTISPSNVIPSGAVFGEAAKYGTPQAKDLLDKLAAETYGIPAKKDVFATNVVESPIVQQQQQQQEVQRKQQEIQQQVNKEPVLSYTPPLMESTATTGSLGYTPNIIASDIAGQDVGLGYDAEQKRIADEKANKEALFKQLMTTPVESVNAGGSTITPGKAITDLTTRKDVINLEPDIQLDQNEVPTIQPEQPEQPVKTEDAFRTLAQKQVDENIAKQTADLDLQIKQAVENRDFSAAQQLQAYKDAIRDVQNRAFLSGQGITQGMANRGLLNSGMYADALLRANMGSQEQIRQLAQTRQFNIDKATLDFNQLQEKINKQRNDILSGRATDIEKATKQLQADQATADKAKADILKQQMDQQNTEWNSFQTALLDAAKANNQDTRQLIPYLATRDKQKVLDFLQASGNMPLTIAGQQAIQDLNYRGTQNDKALQDMYGFEYSNGVRVKDKKGNYIRTLDAINKETDQARKDADLALRKQQQADLNDYRSKQLKIQQQNANTSAKNAVTSASKSTSSKASSAKLPSDAQQRRTIENVIGPLLTDVYVDSQGRKTTTAPSGILGSSVKPVDSWLMPENEKAFNDKMKSLYEQGLIGDKAVIETYMMRNKNAPSWLGAVSDEAISSYGK